MNASPLNVLLHPLLWMALAATAQARADGVTQPVAPPRADDGGTRCATPSACGSAAPRGRLAGPTPDLNGARLVERWEPAAGEKRARELRRLLGPGAVRQHLEDRLDWTGPAGERVQALVVSYPAPKGGA